eukprot:2748328-Amphidinium_carterae.1
MVRMPCSSVSVRRTSYLRRAADDQERTGMQTAVVAAVGFLENYATAVDAHSLPVNHAKRQKVHRATYSSADLSTLLMDSVEDAQDLEDLATAKRAWKALLETSPTNIIEIHSCFYKQASYA